MNGHRLDIDLLIIEENSKGMNSLHARLGALKFRNLSSITSFDKLPDFKGKEFDIILYALPQNTEAKLQLISVLQKMFLECRVILVSHDITPELMQIAIKYGVHDFLHEPVNIETIPTLISRNMEQKHVMKYNMLKQKSEILMKAIKALIAAMEAKDKTTSGHSLRVLNYTMMLSSGIDLNEEEKFILQLSAALHDIGKIGISDNILNKNSSLQKTEYDLVKAHPIIGSEIVGRIDELDQVSDIIRHHHERFDGSGYPDGLIGEDIPLFSRIIAIADTYEALISDRIYRRRLDKEKALKVLKRNAGTQFDPLLVELFIEKIRKNNFKAEDKILADERF
jgi:HD-GYP domain-containing protein (c-di-GMP phosphodiesterase class II)